MFEKFPFKDEKNTAAITCRHIIKDRREILYVSHDEDDGMWQFLCGEPHEADEAMIVSLHEIFMHDHSVAAIAELPLGCEAERKDGNSEWIARQK